MIKITFYRNDNNTYDVRVWKNDDYEVFGTLFLEKGVWTLQSFADTGEVTLSYYEDLKETQEEITQEIIELEEEKEF